MASYQITVDGVVVEERKRVDAALRVYEATKVEDGQTKELVANGETVATHTGTTKKARAKREHHCGDEVAVYLQPLSIDEVVAVAIEMFEQAVLLTREGKRGTVFLLSPAKRERDASNIEKAIRRAKGEGEYSLDQEKVENGEALAANPGSARMSLGLMIRKYVKMGVALPEHKTDTMTTAAA